MTVVAALAAAGVAMMQPAMALPSYGLLNQAPPAETLQGNAAGSRLPIKDNEVSATSTDAVLEEILTPLYESVLPTNPTIAFTISENAAKDLYLELKIDESNMYTLFMGIGDLWSGQLLDVLTADITLTGYRIVNGLEQIPVEYLSMNMAEMIMAVLKNNQETLGELAHGEEQVHPVNLVMNVIEKNMPEAENTKFWEAMSMVATEWITRVNVDTAAETPAAADATMPAAGDAAVAAEEPAAADAAAMPAGDDAAVRHLAVITDYVSATFKASRQHGSLRA